MDLLGLLNIIITAAASLLQITAGILGTIFSSTIGRIIELFLGKSTEQALQHMFVFSAMKMPVKAAALDYIRTHCKKIKIPTFKDVMLYLKQFAQKRWFT